MEEVSATVCQVCELGKYWCLIVSSVTGAVENFLAEISRVTKQKKIS